MEGGLGEKVYQLLETRPRVLVNSRLVSRDKWKEKCGVAKNELHLLQTPQDVAALSTVCVNSGATTRMDAHWQSTKNTKELPTAFSSPLSCE